MHALATIAIAVGLVSAAGYGLNCWVWPFANCGRCDGSGKRRSPSGKAFRLCRRCKGTGRRLRIGRRLYNAIRQRTQEAR